MEKIEVLSANSFVQLMRDYELDHLCILERRVVLK